MLLIAFWLSLCFIFFFHRNKRREMVFLWAVVLYVFALPITFDYLNGVEGVLASTIEAALFYAVLFNLLYIVGVYFLCVCAGGSSYADEYPNLQGLKSNVVIFWGGGGLIFLVVLSSFMIYLKYGSFLGVGWRDNKSISGYIYILYLYYFFASVIGLCFLNGKNIRALFFLLVCTVFVLIFQSRSLMLPALMPVGLMLFVRYGFSIKILLSCVIFLVLFYLVLEFRQSYYSGSFSLDLLKSNVQKAFVDREGELSIIKSFYYMIDHRNYIEGFGEGGTFIKVVTFFVPDFIDKPNDLIFSLWDSYTLKTGVGGSMHPTLYGIFFGNFGWYGVLCAPLIPLLSIFHSWLSRNFHDYGMSIGGLLGGLVLCGRGSFYNGFMLIVVCLILSLVFSKIVSAMSWRSS